MKKNPAKPVPVTVTAPTREEGVHQDTEYSVLLHEIREMISSTRNRALYGVNRETALLYWNIGARMYQEVLQKDRGEYGKKIVATLSRQLLHESGQGFHWTNLFSVAHFVNFFHDPGIVQTLSGQLPVALREEITHRSVFARIQMIEEILRPGIVSPLRRQSHRYQKILPNQRVVSPGIPPEQYGF